MIKQFSLFVTLGLVLVLNSTLYADDHAKDEEKPADNTLTRPEQHAGWVLMFNGKDLTGWKCSTDSPESARVENGTIVTNGERAHLFYGENGDAMLKDFEFQADVMCVGPSNSGIYFHTKYQADGWPANGFEAQVCNGYKDPRKTGSIYAVSDIRDESPAKDDAWFHYRLKVQGKNVKIWINEKLVKDWTQPDDWKDEKKSLKGGTIALQCHDPGSKVLYKNLKVRELSK